VKNLPVSVKYYKKMHTEDNRLLFVTKRQKKGTTFLLWINPFLQNLVLLLLMSIIIDVNYLISGTDTNLNRMYKIV